MSKNGFFSRLRRLETQDVADFSAEEVHVLAVDDSLVDRKVIERLLRITSCKVTAVDSGRRALQFLGLDDEDENENENPSGFDVGLKVDLVITDYCMPEMTGYDLLKKIKGSSNLREIPVVIMSSENVLARIDRCLEEGAEEFLVKPVKLADVERLKNYMFGGNGKVQNNQDSGGVNKRKLQETTSDVSVSPSPSPSPPSSPSPDNTSSSPTPSPPPTSSPNSPISFSSMPCSPTSRDSWLNNDTNELKKKIF